MDERTEPERPLQRLTKEPRTIVTRPYVLADDYGLFKTFDTAQEAFAWIATYTPAAITRVNIQHFHRVECILTARGLVAIKDSTPIL